MANIIDDATIDYVGILAKLELTSDEKEQDFKSKSCFFLQIYCN